VENLNRKIQLRSHNNRYESNKRQQVTVFKKYPLYTVFVLLAILVQHFVLSKLVILHVAPDLLTIVIAFVAITVGFISGLLIGFLSGNPGLFALIGTVEGFVAGFFHVPEDSHATSVKKRRMFYLSALFALLSGNMLQAILNDPLSLPLFMRIVTLAGLGTLLSMLISVIMYYLLLKKILTD
jgi:rod shape-determining protein MreD